MGLDAFVFCDCWERGRAKPLPRAVGKVHVLPNGELDCVIKDPAVQARFDRWRRACRHEDDYAASGHLGNIASVALLTTGLRPVARRFPLLLRRVLYCGSHTGDHLTPRQVERLEVELGELADVPLKDPEVNRELRRVCRALGRLVRVALRLGKPIAF